MDTDYECQLSADCLEYAERILNETAENRENSVDEIAIWLRENPTIAYDIKFILYFLRGAKFNVEKAKRKMKSFYRMRQERIEWFRNRDCLAPEIQELLELGVMLPLRTKDADNRQVFIIRTAAHDPKKHTQNNVFKVGQMIIDLVLSMDETISVYGITAIFDMTNVTAAHALQLPPTMIKKCVESWENYPCRTHMMEFVNAPIYVNVILNIFRSFMSTKMKSRISVTKGKSKCDALLPSDLGGKGESYSELTCYWKKVMEDNASWFVEEEKQRNVSPLISKSSITSRTIS